MAGAMRDTVRTTSTPHVIGRHVSAALLLLATSLAAAAAEGTAAGRLTATGHGHGIAPGPIYIRTAETTAIAPHIRIALSRALTARGYTVELGAAHTLAFRTRGAFRAPPRRPGPIQLYGRAGTSTRPTGRIDLRLPRLGAEGLAHHRYQLDLEIYDDEGRPLWTASAILVSAETDALGVAETLIAHLLERIGETVDQPLGP